MRIVVTGAAGYLGSHVCEQLLDVGHDVLGVDIEWFGPSHLKDHERFEFVHGDVRSKTVLKFALNWKPDSVIFLAALSNDPAGELDPDVTHRINSTVPFTWAAAAKEAKVPRFVFASSCSIYGPSKDLEVKPLTAYGKSKWDAECCLATLAGMEFFVKILRLGTLYGPSFSMRFDLAINLMARDYAEKGFVRVLGGGKQVRPFCSVHDAAWEFVQEALRGPSCTRHVVGFNAQIGVLAKFLVGNDVRVQLTDPVDERNYAVPENQAFGRLEDAKAIFDGMVSSVKMGRWKPTTAHKYYRAVALKEIISPKPWIPLCQSELNVFAGRQLKQHIADTNGYASPNGVVREFERRCADILGVSPPQVVATNSCTSALMAAAYLSGFKGPGRKVFLPPITWGATANAFSLLSNDNSGCLRWVDVNSVGLIEDMGFEKQGYHHLHSVCLVDLGGRLSALSVFRNNLGDGANIIVDAAQSFGRKFDDDADFMCFSFAPTKNMTTGDGGLIVMKNQYNRSDIIRFLTNGMDPCREGMGSKKVGFGIKGRMNELTAVMGLAMLHSFDVIQNQRRSARYEYVERLALAGCDNLIVPHLASDEPHLMQLLVPNRNELVKLMRQNWIQTGLHYWNLGGPDLPGAVHWANHTISLPLWSGITKEEIQRVVDVVKEHMEGEKDG
jgi:dTDP-4-amino-4,6-dideoxygalactose transaminase/nucleoside-diphosphate-sugar epimerase